MSKIVLDGLVLDYDTVAPLLRSALADDQAIHDLYPSDVGYLINVVAQSAADAILEDSADD